MNSNKMAYKKILEKYGFSPSDKEVVKIANNIKSLANVFVQFAKNRSLTDLKSTEYIQQEDNEI